MKKVLLTLLAFLTVGGAWADNVTVADVEVLPGGTATLELYLDNTSGTFYRDFGFTFNLAEGITRDVSKDGITAGPVLQEAASILPGGQTLVMCVPDQDAVDQGLVNIEDYYLKESGVLLYIKINASADLKDGTVLDCSLDDFELSDKDGHAAIRIASIPFKVKISSTITLDENSTTAPEAAENVNVLVKRTIKAGNWSTICLPFAMDANQMETAFGKGVELADFEGYEETYDAAEVNVIAIDVKFATATTFEANHPYIIKVGADVSEFKLDGVNLEPSEEDALVEYDNGKTGKQRVVWGTFQGNYTAETLVPENNLFISGNKFYYSTGATKMKAFRGYFWFTDELAVKALGAKINFSVDGDATSIDGIGTQRVVEGVYDLSGRKIQLENGDLNKLQKGVYIIDGKKVTIK